MELRTLSRFRTAINAEEWAEAERFLAEMRAEVETAWKHASSDAERAQLQTEVSEILEWARRMAETDRAHSRGNLIRMKSRRAYLETPAPSDLVAIEG